MSQTSLYLYKLGCDVKPSEYSWEVMEHSENVGEKPIRLVIGPDAIRTVTSLLLKRPTEQKEHWKVPSCRIIKVSWCPELCVFSVLYFKPDDIKEYTKAFFVDGEMGKKIVKRYKKIKPVNVHLSPGPKKMKKKGYKEESNHVESIKMKSSFILPICDKEEKMWRATLLDSTTGEVREIFLGISPIAVRVVEPVSLETEWCVDHLHLLGIKYQTRFPNNNILTLKYFMENFGKFPKSQSKHFHVLPVTSKEILHYFDQCNIHSAEAKCELAPPSFKSLPEIGHPPVLGTNPESFPRSQSVPDTETPLVNPIGGDYVGQKLSKKARPKSVKLPFQVIEKDEPPRSASARRPRPKSTSGDLLQASALRSLDEGDENRAQHHAQRSRPVSAASAPPLYCQPLTLYEPNLPQGNVVKSHSRHKSVHVVPNRDNVYYCGKEGGGGGGLKKFVKDALEGPRVAYQ